MVTIKVPVFRRADFLLPIAIATALIISVGVASAVDLERGLVAYYSFDDCSAKDLSGNGNDGIIYGAKCVDGKFGKALRFDGVDDYVELPDASFKSNAFTIVAWVKFSSIAANGVVVGKYYNGFLWWDAIANCMRVEFRNSADTAWRGIPQDGGVCWKPAVNTWYHLAASFGGAGTTVKLYVNGQLVSETDVIEQNPLITTEMLAVGRWGKSSKRYFNGIIDEVRIYNRALSEEEIRALYERGVAPRPKLAIEMDIDTSLKQGEVRKGTIRVENIGNSDAKSVEVRLFSESLGIDVEKSYAKIPSGEARELLFEVSADEAGTFKLSAYAEYWDDRGNKYVETAEKSVHVEPVMLPTRETPKPAGFQAIPTSLLIMVSYFLIKLREKKRN